VRIVKLSSSIILSRIRVDNRPNIASKFANRPSFPDWQEV
jgi:hypothetical protein